MAAKENFFKAMKELTGMGNAEDTTKQMFAVPSASKAESEVQPIQEKADKPLFAQMVAADEQDTMIEEATEPQLPPQGQKQGAQPSFLEKMLQAKQAQAPTSEPPSQSPLSEQVPAKEMFTEEEPAQMASEQEWTEPVSSATEQKPAVMPESVQPFQQPQLQPQEPQNVGEGFLGNWPLQQDKPQPTEQQPQQPQEPQPPLQPKEPQGPAATVISASMVITGEVKSTGNLEILGMIKGPVITTGNMTIEGKILGNIEGNDIVLKGCAIQGNINATGNVNMDQNSVVIGDLRAANLEVNGKIKGNLEIQERIDLNKEAVVDGNASSRYVSMSQGAKLNGNVSVTADRSTEEDIFDIQFDI